MSDKTTAGAAIVAGKPADPRELLPVAEVAEKLGISGMTVRRRIHSGAWPSGRCGRKLLLPRPFVEGLLLAINSGSRVSAEEFAAKWMASQPQAVAS